MSATMKNAVPVVLALVLFGCRECRNNEGEIEPWVYQDRVSQQKEKAVAELDRARDRCASTEESDKCIQRSAARILGTIEKNRLPEDFVEMFSNWESAQYGAGGSIPVIPTLAKHKAFFSDMCAQPEIYNLVIQVTPSQRLDVFYQGCNLGRFDFLPLEEISTRLYHSDPHKGSEMAIDHMAFTYSIFNRLKQQNILDETDRILLRAFLIGQ